jgi:succinate dehydrogenase flavin-adding protein (antitoxin of CptAB toxin-antitoxin module)
LATDHYKLKDKSDADLHDWVCGQEPGRKREMIAMIIAGISIALIIIAIFYVL